MSYLETKEGLLGKSGVASWLEKARLTSIKAQVYKNLGMDPRPVKQRREYKPQVVECAHKHTSGSYCYACGMVRTGKVKVNYVTKTKGYRALSSLVSWEDLDAAVTLAIEEGNYGFYHCRTTMTFREGPARCPYCTKQEEKRKWL